jgi:hypothetical protein
MKAREKNSKTYSETFMPKKRSSHNTKFLRACQSSFILQGVSLIQAVMYQVSIHCNLALAT